MTDQHDSRAPGALRRWRLLLLLALAMAVFPAVTSGTAQAASLVPISNAVFEWSYSFNATHTTGEGGSSSLSQARAAEAPAELTASGWRFSGGQGFYDPYTGRTTIDFEGALSVGNTGFGNFGQRLSEPSILVDATGHGSLTATVSIRGPGSEVWNAPVGRVVVATWDAPDDSVNVSGTDVSWTFTPFFTAVSDNRRQWDPTFYDLIPSSMQASYREGAPGGTQPNKGPAPVSVSFTFAPPSLTASQADGLTAAGQTITVTGAGFRPNIHLFVAHCDANFDAGARCDFQRVTQVLTTPEGTFSTPLTVAASFGAGPTATSCLASTAACAVQTSWVENPSDRSQEATLPLHFAAAPAPLPAVAAGAAGTTPPAQLAFTGASSVPLAIAGFLLVVAGTGLVIGTRREKMPVA